MTNFSNLNLNLLPQKVVGLIGQDNILDTHMAK